MSGMAMKDWSDWAASAVTKGRPSRSGPSTALNKAKGWLPTKLGTSPRT
jgi:hypothetical protein